MKLINILKNRFFPETAKTTTLVNESQLYKNKKDIVKWLDQHDIKKYVLIPDRHYGYVVHVNETVYLEHMELSCLKVKFNKVIGDFNCDNNNLTSLEGAPMSVSKGFYCHKNKLINLKFAPTEVHGCFSCYGNNLVSLEGCPQKLGDYLNCSWNKLTSLEFCPKIVGGYFNFIKNNVESLYFCPEKINGDFLARNNKNLAHLQNISDFSIIYQEHLKYKEKKDFAEKLNSELNIPAENRSHRVKI